MPKIHLIRRDGGIIELEALTISFNVQRGVAVHPIPIFGIRAGLDLNNSMFDINISGVMADDKEPSGASAAVSHFDLSRPGGGLFGSWFSQQTAAGNDTIAKVVTGLHGKEIVFKSKGQRAAGLGEDIALRFYSSSVPAATVATNSVIPVNLTGSVANTGVIVTAMNTALTAASVRVNAVTTAITAIFTIAQGAGQYGEQSGSHQSAGTLTNEKITLTNKTDGADGNSITIVRGHLPTSTTQDWANAFFNSNFTNGVDGSKKSKGDKVQDLIDMTVNVSAGGGMLSPQSFTGDLIELPDSLSSFDVSKLLRIDEAESVKKYIVGVRIPYDSMVTAATGLNSEVRQFLVPAGPGVNYPASKNTETFDPVDIIGGELVRPNPFFRQGIAIPAVVQTFTPNYEAADSVWTYTLTLAACEQLLGI